MGHSRRKSLLGNRRGYSAVIATIFMVLAVLFLYFNVYMYIQKQDARLQDAVSQSAQLDTDHGIEARYLNVFSVAVTGSGTNRTLNCSIENNTPLPVMIVRVWVKNSSSLISAPISIVLQPGARPFFQFSIPRGLVSNQFSLFFVTSRGNVIPYVT
jgi:hypothetical protein